ncbi:MAG: hypothetical protein ABIJ46_01855 [bacterium]
MGATVQANGRTALQILSRKIREARSVLLPLPGNVSDGLLVLDMPDPDSDVSFLVQDGVLLMSEVGYPDVSVTDGRTRLDGLTFTNLSPAGGRSNMQIQMDISYAVPIDDAQFGFSKSYRTSVSVRP